MGLLRDRSVIGQQPEAVVPFLDALRSEWKSMRRPQTTEIVRRLVWRVTWKAKREQVELEFDEIAIRSLIDGDTELL